MKPWLIGSLLAAASVTIAASAVAQANEKRTVVFRDGLQPRLEVSGDRYVHGALDLVIEFKDTNPLCFAYTLDEDVPAAAPPVQPQRFEGAMSSGPGSVVFSDVEAALAAVDARMQELGTLSMEASDKGSLDDVWDTCLWTDPPAKMLAVQERRIAEVDALLKSRLADNGAWTRVLVASIDTLASVRRRADSLVASKPVDLQPPARRRLLDSAAELERYVTASFTMVRHLQQDLEEAHVRLASKPTVITRSYEPGERVTVKVRRTRLEKGQVAAGADAAVISAQAYRTLSPILFDVGIGPAVTFKNVEEYGLSQRVDGRVPNVSRKRDDLNADGVIALSMYIWGSRHLDDTVFAWQQLLPRPMLGVSMSQPFKSLYFGGQIDPIQFLDISFGARAYSTEFLLDPGAGKPAYTDAAGVPQEPATRKGVTTQLFLSLSFSTDLVQRWIAGSF